MALNDENMVMPVAPMYGNQGGFGNSFGGDGWWIILLFILLGNNGWGNGFGMGGFNSQLGYDFPWLMNGQNGINANTNAGFQNAMLNDGITSIRDGISGLSTQLCNCCGDMQMGMANGFAGVQQSLCNGFAGTAAAVNGAQNAIAQQMYANQISDLERSFAAQAASTQGMTALQAQLAQCCCDNRAATADLKYTVATENCADRAALSDGVRDIIASQTAATQRILDQLCQDKIDAKNDTIAQLRQELLFARGQASQDVQTAELRANNATVANQLLAEMRSCPIPAQPVYGNSPIFSCNNNGCGCGCGVG